jgi:PAS domain S-box-containing protein
VVLLRDLPPKARWYIITVIGIGAVASAVLVPRTEFLPIVPLLFLVALSALTSAFKVQFPIASGSNMSVSYVVDIAALILRGPHAAMIVGAASAFTQSTFNQPKGKPNPTYRTLFNMAILVLTAQASGQVYRRLGGATTMANPLQEIVPLAGTALTYFLFNTVPIALAIALSTSQNAFRIWKRELASSVTSYVLGAAAAAIVLAVTESSGIWFAVLLLLAPLYLTYKVYRTGADVEAKQGAILQAANDAIITMDSQLAIREFNPAAEKMFGYVRMDILGRHVELLLPPASRATALDALGQYSQTGRGPLSGKQIEMIAVRADGTEFPIELTVARVGAEGTRAMTGFLRDISDRRKLEEQLRQSQKLEAIGRLASGVAHDVNNVLMSIMGSADLILMDAKEGDAIHAETSEIKISVQRGASLTRQLLAFSRRQATVSKKFMLREATAGMETMLRRLIGPEIDLQILRTSDVMVKADPAQMEQVILNLCVNARDAMPQGGRLTVTVDEVELNEWAAGLIGEEARPGRYARLSVSDTGTGMDEATRAKLFEPFFTTKEQGKGTGLGLSIVYGIVKQSGGHITVASEPGRGATFLIYLPLATEDAPAPSGEPAPV